MKGIVEMNKASYRRYRRKKRRRKILKIIRICTFVILIIFIGKEVIKNINKGAENKNKADNAIDVNSDYIESQNNNFNNTSQRGIRNTLESMVKKDRRMKKVLKNYDSYPEELLGMLSRNIEMLDFVLDYPKMKGNVYADNVGKVKKDGIPLLLQWDPRWGYGNYGESIIGISGCGPTSLSMVITGLTGDNSVTPYDVAKFAEEQEYYVPGTGTSWSLFTEGSRHFGVEGREIPLARSSIYNALQSGHPIICSMRPGDFTTTGHIIVLTGIKNGKITINDPNSKEKSNQLWDYQTLEHQINNLWAFTLL